MKLSIIIPTVGRETLNAVLEGVLGSDNFEDIDVEILIVFDGKGKDFFKKLVDSSSFTGNFGEVEIVFLETGERSYAGGARNFGIEKSTGDVLVFIGDDTIPDKAWLQKVYDFHVDNLDEKVGLLGKISWVDRFAGDGFYKFLNSGPQFNFKQIEKKGADWHHFYTSNVSVKKSFVAEERFSDEFEGWGFEDTEFGYRLAKKGLKLAFDDSVQVYHDHEQSFDQVLENTRNMRKNALVFEKLHPEVSILPRGMKKLVLKVLVFLCAILPVGQRLKWWGRWKNVWIA
ncbi:MAG: glycosyltransferase [Candidatus Peregrinibacteria bacterium]|nr:glycosyltransferase [Candidatus Peregrinibacteria bacterium]